ncbi:aminotransferase-like domain-containing protein [Mycolicibacterium aubagnense]|uniref:GntR family transcriptional regulator n=1 Tax=Mycolicibacterium aubagnense TaxID=319707 RepID=A0ABN5YYG7_9MYCO|nr:PLP-dependent aminotransferase family protein [Mycolicibacterium aubagnense]TLH68934.1 PLP-dependent aminotransferase family protein [Mycolicibacterium aubagnense]WGI32464.1 PLP-dependent aminotransferase family protein [Mycolicibacterium aubagnense]BBX85961.1 GntR family transcriptional regulator [Mycolicibacterium aubagnense]
MARHTRLVHLPLDTADLSARSIASQLVALIAAGQVGDGDWLPSTRALAHDLGASRTMVAAAYDELVAAGFLEGVPGAGTRTTAGATAAARAGLSSRTPRLDDTAPAPAAHDARRPTENLVDLRPGSPDTGLIDMRAWTRAWRAAAASRPTAVSPWEGPDDAFTAAMAHHLRINRGVDTHTVFDIPGSTAAVQTLAAVSGLSRCYLESPCYPAAAEEFTRAGLDTTFIPVDQDGLCVDELGDEAGIVYTTPAHQYPLGHRLSVNRRAELVAWAKRTGSIVIEDDYDGEFRYGVAPLPAIRSIPGAGAHVAYVGTASKILASSLGAAWLVPPLPLCDAVQTYLHDHRIAVSTITRIALTELITAGDLQRHLARSGREYRCRRDILITELEARCPNLEVLGVQAGLHVAILLPDGHRDRDIAQRLNADGLIVAPLSAFPQRSGAEINGLAVNFARINRATAQRFAEAIAAAIK